MSMTAATIDVELRANTARYRAEMLAASRTSQQRLGEIQREAKRTADTFELMKRSAIGVVSFQALRGSLGTLVQARKEVEALHLGLRGATGSSLAAQQSYDFVSQQAKQLGLDLQTAATGFMRLTASATPNGVAMKEQRDLFVGISRAATVMQLDSQKVDSAVTALSQSFGKGRFQAEELRQQLGEAIPGILPRFQNAVLEMTKGTDLAGQSFEDLLQKGLLDTKRFLPAMIQAFDGMATGWEEASRSMQAEQNRLGNAWRKLREEASQGAFSDIVVASLRGTTVALEGMGNVLPVVVPALSALAAVKLGERSAEWVRGLKASHIATVQQAVSARDTAAALVMKTRREMEDAAASAQRAQMAYGGSIAADLAATTATRAHERALLAHEAAQLRATAATHRFAQASRAALGFFGGPLGLAFMVGSTAASWWMFRDSTDGASRSLLDFNGTAEETVAKFKEMNAQQQAGAVLRLSEQIAEETKSVRRSMDELTAIAARDIGGTAAIRYRTEVVALTRQFEAGRVKADEYSARLAALNTGLLDGAPAAARLTSQFVGETSAAADAAVALDRKRVMLGQLSSATGSAAAAARDGAGAMREMGSSADDATKRIQNALKTLPGQIARIGRSAAEVAQMDVNDWMQGLARDRVVLDPKVWAQRRQEGREFVRLMGEQEAAQKSFQASTRDARSSARQGNTDAEYTQTFIRNAEARRKELQFELAAGENLSQAKRELLKFELEMRDTKNAAMRQSEGTIRAMLEENVALEEQRLAIARTAEAKQRGLAIDRQIADFRESDARRHQRDMAAQRLGGRAAVWNGIETDLSERYQDQRRGVDEDYSRRLDSIPLGDLARRNEAWVEYQQQIGKSVIAETLAVAQARENYAELLAAQGDWQVGAERAWADYQAMVSDVASKAEDSLLRVLSTGEDMWVEWSKTGKLESASLRDAILSDLARIAYQQAIMGMVSGFGQMFGPRITGFAAGGYTGPGGVHQPAGVVHKGEVVWSQRDVARAGGVSAVEGMRLGRRGYAEGGAVGVNVPVSAGGGLQVIVNNQVGGQVRAREEQSRGPDGAILKRLVLDIVRDDIANGGGTLGVIKSRLDVRDRV